MCEAEWNIEEKPRAIIIAVAMGRQKVQDRKEAGAIKKRGEGRKARKQQAPLLVKVGGDTNGVGKRLGGHIRQRAKRRLVARAVLMERRRKKRERKTEHKEEEDPASCDDDNQTGLTQQKEDGEEELLCGSDAEVSSEEGERGELTLRQMLALFVWDDSVNVKLVKPWVCYLSTFNLRGECMACIV